MKENISLPQAALEQSGEGSESNVFDELEDFRITHPKVIGDVLRQLMTHKDFLTVECSHGSHRSITRILEVDQAAGHFVYDSSAEPIHNRALLQAEESYFSAAQAGIRIQFVGSRPEPHEFEGAFAFRAAIPQSLYKVQRREFFRADAPLAESCCCLAVLPDEREVVWEIVDLSLDGLGLRSKDLGLGELQIDTLLSNAVLNFGRRGRMGTDLRVTNLRNIRGPDNPVYRIGCRFEHFPKTQEQNLQRLITFLELTRRGHAQGAVTKDAVFD